MSTTLDIKIQGREYRVACSAGEVDSLRAAAELLDARMGEIARATKSTGERLAVMTALNLANELNSARQDDMSAPERQDVDAATALGRIGSIEARLDEALAAQESLF